MGILDRIDRLFQRAYPTAPPVALTPEIVDHATLDARAALAMQQYAAIATLINPVTVGKPAWPAHDPYVFEANGYRAISLIYRCVNLIAHASGVAPIRVYDEAKNNETVPDHGIRRLMRQPNPRMGEAAFWRSVTKRTAVAGFCVVEKERNRLGEVIALNPLRSNWLKAIPRGRGVYDWEYRIPGVADPYRLKAEDAIPFVWTEATDGSPYGVPPLATCIRDAALLTKMVDFLGTLFDRGGVPLYGLIPADNVEVDSQADADAMLEAFVQRRAGLGRAGIPMILQGIKGVERLQMDLDELAYTDLRDVSELEIVRSFGVPPTKAIIRVGLEHSDSRANAEVDDATFYQDTIVPLWSVYDDVLTTHLIPDFETVPTSRAIEFDVSDVAALQENRNDRAPWVIQGFNGGLLSQHMALGELGIPLPETDDFYLRSIAVEVFPADDPLGATTASATTTAPPQAQQDGQDGALAALGPGESLASRNGHHGPSERLAAVGAQNRKAHIKIADARKPSIAAYFRGLGERVLERVTLASSGGPTETFALPADFWDDEERALLKVLRALYLLAGEQSWANAAAHVGVEISWDLANSKVRDVMDELAKRVTGITEESRRAIAEIVTKAAEEGTSIEDLKGRLKETFDGWSDHRAETVARTESQTSYNLASAAAYEESGVVKGAMLLDNSAHTDHYGAADGWSCAERNGKVVPLDKVALSVSSEHPRGSLSVAPVVAEEE